ncbi:MAG: sugar phosphate isomerase/epimerase family protein [Christensenellales bacterium]|jgi:L-ribulose-5-phosphate 3-epimerase
MKKGMTGFSFPKYMSITEKMQLAKDAGLDGIEFSFTQKGELSAESTPEDLKRIRRSARDIGIELMGLACSMSWQASLTSAQEEIRRRAKDYIRMQIRFAQALGIDTVLTLPGFVGVDFKSKNLFDDPNVVYYDVSEEIVPYDLAWDRALEGYRELAPYAADHGVTMAIENIWSKFLVSPLEFKLFLDSIDSPSVGMYLDTGNMMLYGYPEHWIRILSPYIKRCHFKDYRRGLATLDGFVDILSGDVDFVAVMQALRDIGYDGWVSGEITLYKTFAQQTVYNASHSLDRIIGRVK